MDTVRGHRSLRSFYNPYEPSSEILSVLDIFLYFMLYSFVTVLEEAFLVCSVETVPLLSCMIYNTTAWVRVLLHFNIFRKTQTNIFDNE